MYFSLSKRALNTKGGIYLPAKEVFSILNIPAELEDQYVKEILYNNSLENLPGEEWKLIENFENYAISNYGRLKSLERWIPTFNGGHRKVTEFIMKLTLVKYFNKYLDCHFYNVHCSLSSESKSYRKSVPRLVYYHFVEKFDLNDYSIAISFKDDNRFNIHSTNLEKLSDSQARSKRFQKNRAKSLKRDYQQAVNQYTVEGELVASFESINAARNILGINHRNILTVIRKEGITAGGFRWFLKDFSPEKEDFLLITKDKSDDSGKILNQYIWQKLGKPPIDKNSPPACMNLSLKDLPNEQWKDIPELEGYFNISNKGRIKRLANWTINSKNKTFLQEHIISLLVNVHQEKNTCYFFVRFWYNGRQITLTITRLLYYCFVQEFDLKDKSLLIVNQNETPWDIDISKLSLQNVYTVLRTKDES